ncbi:MAG: type II secretion system F family protein [Gammaproteobacteria bacterium]|nr:type II secretion system F family protein [Gammaproteobacteria bacterium]
MTLFSTKKKQTWLWQGLSAHHQVLSGEISAYTQNLARHALLQKNINVTSLYKKNDSFFKKIPRPTSSDLILFFRQLATLIAADIPVLQTLQMISRNPDHIRLKSICTSLIDFIRKGNALGASLQQFPNYFDHITCQLIAAGEVSGTLDTMLERIATHREQLTHLRRKIIQTLFYPSITFCVAILITLIMLVFVTPRFATLFAEMHVPLPTFTRIVIAIGEIIRRYFFFIILAVSFLGYGIKHHPPFQRWLDRNILRTPIIGKILSKIQHARFARTLATLFAAGIPLPESLRLIAPAIGNDHYTEIIQRIRHEIITGQPLHHAIQQTHFFPSTLHQMIEIGEESGTLEKMLLKSSEFLESEVDHFISLASQLLEPLIIIILGVLIGALLVAMYLPIFKLGSVI